MLITGFKSEGEAVIIPPTIAFKPTLENYQMILDLGVVGYFLNSVTATLVSTLIALLIGVPAAYALTMYRVKKRETIFCSGLSLLVFFAYSGCNYPTISHF